MDALPIFSQVKSSVLFIFGRREEAKETQITFSKQCPGVSQVRSLCEGISGNPEAALETQKECGRFLLGVVNCVPLLGHIKGGIHYARGDAESGNAAMKAAYHTSCVMLGSALGMMVGGPVVKVVLGIVSGAAADATITAIDSEITGKPQPYGILEPLSDPTNAGKWCNAAFGVVLDGVAALAAGEMIQQSKILNLGSTAVAAALKDDAVVRYAQASSIVNWNTVSKNAMGGVRFLLKDGGLKKMKEFYAQLPSLNVIRAYDEKQYVSKVPAGILLAPRTSSFLDGPHRES